MHESHTLARDALLSLPAAAGATIAVQGGSIWFTADGADVVLGPGHDYQLARDEALLIEALADARFSLHSPAPRSRLQARLASLLGRKLASV